MKGRDVGGGGWMRVGWLSNKQGCKTSWKIRGKKNCKCVHKQYSMDTIKTLKTQLFEETMGKKSKVKSCLSAT